MTRYTSPDNLPIPDDYQDPADSPTVIGALGDAVQAALTAIRSVAITAGTGLIGGGNLSQSRTLSVDTNTIATRTYADGKVTNGLSQNSSTVAPAQAAVNTALAGKANASHTHGLTFKVGRPATAFPIGADQSTGIITIAHGLGRAPTAVFVSADDDGGSCSVFASVNSFDATYIYAHMRNIGADEAHVYINWIAF